MSWLGKILGGLLTGGLFGSIGGGSKKTVVVNNVSPATPTTTSADVQAAEEARRRKLSYSSKGIGSTIATSALGDTSSPVVRGVALGGL